MCCAHWRKCPKVVMIPIGSHKHLSYESHVTGVAAEKTHRLYELSQLHYQLVTGSGRKEDASGLESITNVHACIQIMTLLNVDENDCKLLCPLWLHCVCELLHLLYIIFFLWKWTFAVKKPVWCFTVCYAESSALWTVRVIQHTLQKLAAVGVQLLILRCAEHVAYQLRDNVSSATANAAVSVIWCGDCVFEKSLVSHCNRMSYIAANTMMTCSVWYIHYTHCCVVCL